MSNPTTIHVPEGQPVLEFTREFDAPVAAVFEAHRDPELLKQWMGPHGFEMDVERHDFTSGGGYRYCHRTPDGEEYWFHGTFHTVREGELAIQTFEFEPYADQVSLETLRFVDLGDGRTRLEGRAVYLTQDARDAMASSGWDHGVTEGYERLDEVLLAPVS